MNKNTAILKKVREIIGVQAFCELGKVCSGDTVVFNNYMCHGFVSKEERDRAIMKDLYHGMFPLELAEKYDLGIDAIYKITESTRKSD